MSQGSNQAVLRGHAGAFKGVAIPIPPDGLTMGRESPGVDRLAFDALSDVSRQHCTVRYEARTRSFSVTDHGSINGTFLLPQLQRVAPHQDQMCASGQMIRLGADNIFELVAASASAAAAPAPAPAPESMHDYGYQESEAGSESTSGLPRLREGQRLDIAAIRVPYERLYKGFALVPAVLLGLAFLGGLIAVPLGAVPFQVAFEFLGKALLYVLALLLLYWISWKLTLANLLGNAIRVGPNQYPQIDRLVTQASAILNVKPPTVLILQGHGIFEIFVARHFSRRGVLIMTSNLLDDLAETGSSREFMFYVGRQLGMIASGYFDYWFFKHTLGQFAWFFYLAWQRRCHLTADRLGLLVTGDLLAAERAMLLLAAGKAVTANTRAAALLEQREDVFASGWSWINLGFSSYPYMIDRIVRMRDFAEEARQRGIESGAPAAIGALPIEHRAIRALPVIIVHGHDRTARLELENFLRSKLPHVEPILMIDETDAAASLPEKFERVGRGAKGVLVLLTPDDVASAKAQRSERFRARQNVIGEMFFFWAKLGRRRMLLLTCGDVEIPSDLSGVDVHRYGSSPMECSEIVRNFISKMEME